jgi:hypothetical protein
VSDSFKFCRNISPEAGREVSVDINRRHLVRLWLRDPENAWETPTHLRPRWANVYDGVTSENQVFPLDPVVRTASNVSRKISS